MTAFFRNTTQYALDGNVPNTPPVVTVPPRLTAEMGPIGIAARESTSSINAGSDWSERRFSRAGYDLLRGGQIQSALCFV